MPKPAGNYGAGKESRNDFPINPSEKVWFYEHPHFRLLGPQNRDCQFHCWANYYPGRCSHKSSASFPFIGYRVLFPQRWVSPQCSASFFSDLKDTASQTLLLCWSNYGKELLHISPQWDPNKNGDKYHLATAETGLPRASAKMSSFTPLMTKGAFYPFRCPIGHAGRAFPERTEKQAPCSPA